MSLIVSRRPSSRNHWNEAFWMSIRLGRSRTFSIREKDLRARGEATFVVKEKASLGDVRDSAFEGVQNGGRAERRRNLPGYRRGPPTRKRSLRREGRKWNGRNRSAAGAGRPASGGRAAGGAAKARAGRGAVGRRRRRAA